MVGDGDAPQLHIIFGRNTDFGVEFEFAMALPEFRPPLGEDGFVSFCWLRRGLIGKRPEFARFNIADVTKASPTISSSVLAPARERQVLPATVTAARAAHDEMVTTIRQQMDIGPCRIGIGEDTHDAFAFVGELAR